jgi:Tfp pilus assembly protein PilV
MQLPKSAAPVPPARPSGSEAGFSVIEGLIAALLLLVVTLGILPLFSRSMSNNVKGNDSTRQANAAVSSFESSAKVPFNSADMMVPNGSTSLVVTETLALKKIASPTGGADQTMSTRWELPASLATGDIRVMNRQRTLRYYSLSDFDDNQVFDTPLDGATEARQIHLKVLDLSIQDATGASPSAFRTRTVEVF